MSETRKLAAILVADVVGYSRLAGAQSDNPVFLRQRERVIDALRAAVSISAEI
jgi:class 3 adenylate cyclase